MVDTKIIERDGKVMLLAYDQGFEHGPVDFNEKNIDPTYVMNIAKNGYFTGVIFQEGVAAKYYEKDSGVPLILKLNGKTSFQKDEPLSLQLCTVDRAIELGAVGVGYTVFVGSEHEEEMMREFSRIEDEAHAKGLIVIAWMYPRGKKVEGKEKEKDIDKEIEGIKVKIAELKEIKERIEGTKEETEKKLAEVAEVLITQTGFEPKEITIKVNQKLVWKNEQDKLPALVLGVREIYELRSGLLEPGQEFIQVFSQPGEYTYVDGIVLGRVGKVVVQ